MRIILIMTILVSLMSGECHAFSLSDQQYKNLDVINIALRAEHSEFTGFNGTQHNMKAIGLSDAVAKNSINAMNIDKLKKNDPKRKKMKKIRNKFKSMGFDNDDLEFLGYNNDIPDL